MDIENQDSNSTNATIGQGGIFGAILAKHGAPSSATPFTVSDLSSSSSGTSKFGFLGGANSSSSSSMTKTSSMLSPGLSKSATRETSGIPSPSPKSKSIFGGSIFGIGGTPSSTSSATATAATTVNAPSTVNAIIPAQLHTTSVKINMSSRVTPQSIQQQKKTPTQTITMNPSMLTLTSNRTPFSTMQPTVSSLVKPLNLSSSLSSSKSAPSSTSNTPRRDIVDAVSSNNLNVSNSCSHNNMNVNNNSNSNSNSNCFTPSTISFGRTVRTGCNSSRDNAIAADISARKARMLSTTEKIQHVSAFKEQWAKEKEQKLQRIQNQRDKELKKIQEMSLSATESRKKNLEVQRSYEESVKNEERDQLRVYLDDRIYANNEVESQEKSRRRQSIALRQEIMTKAKEAVASSANKLKEMERDHYSHKNQDFISIREARYSEDKRRRESMAGRGEEDRRRKMVQEGLDQLSKETELGYLEFRRKVWENERDCKVKGAQKKRESMAGRLDTWRKQREVEREREDLCKLEEQSRFEASYTDWQDIEQYKRKQCAKERESLAGRLAKWRQDKAFDVWMQSEAEEAREIEQQLRDQAYEDTKAYERKQKDLRRQSLAFRLEQAKKNSEQDRDQSNLHSMLEIEELRLKKLDHDDMSSYVRSLQEAKRKSMHMRNVAAHEAKKREDMETQEEMAKQHESFELSENAWRDVKAYQERMREEARESLAFRLVEAKQGHEFDLNEHRKCLDNIHDELASKRLNWVSLNEYKAQEQEKRRMSVAYRIDSWKKEKIAMEMWRSKQQILLDEDALLKAQDWEDLQNAKRDLELQARADVLNRMAF